MASKGKLQEKVTHDKSGVTYEIRYHQENSMFSTSLPFSGVHRLESESVKELKKLATRIIEENTSVEWTQILRVKVSAYRGVSLEVETGWMSRHDNKSFTFVEEYSAREGTDDYKRSKDFRYLLSLPLLPKEKLSGRSRSTVWISPDVFKDIQPGDFIQDRNGSLQGDQIFTTKFSQEVFEKMMRLVDMIKMVEKSVHYLFNMAETPHLHNESKDKVNVIASDNIRMLNLGVDFSFVQGGIAWTSTRAETFRETAKSLPKSKLEGLFIALLAHWDSAEKGQTVDENDILDMVESLEHSDVGHRQDEPCPECGRQVYKLGLNNPVCISCGAELDDNYAEQLESDDEEEHCHICDTELEVHEDTGCLHCPTCTAGQEPIGDDDDDDFDYSEEIPDEDTGDYDDGGSDLYPEFDQ